MTVVGHRREGEGGGKLIKSKIAILKDCIEVQEKQKRGSLSFVQTSSTKREIRHFHVVVVQREGNVQKSRDARAKLLFCLSNLPLFCPSRCRRRRRC